MLGRSKCSLDCALLWIISLALLSVGARNFEPGLSIDAPLYAAIARQIARSGEWFHMSGGVPDFQPFAEHPHLGFWMGALIFKVLPAADWSIRILGHLSYVLFLWLFYRTVKRFHGSTSAVCGVLLLWLWPIFGNFFSTFYLDGPFLVFASAGALIFGKSLFKEKNSVSCTIALGLAAGFLNAAALLTKGLAFAGFIPLLGLLIAAAIKDGKIKTGALATLAATFATTLVLVIYSRLLSASSVPDFFNIYWSRQFSSRFGQTNSTGALFDTKFYWALFRDTYFLAPLVVFGFWGLRKDRRLAIPAILFLTYVGLYALKARIGGQYWITVMPWTAWLMVATLPDVPRLSGKLMQVTSLISIAVVLFLQYTPLKTHNRPPPAEAPALLALKHEGVQELYIYNRPSELTFIRSSPYAWYGDIDVKYASSEDPNFVQANLQSVLLTFSETPLNAKTAASHNWCPIKEYGPSTLWGLCGAVADHWRLIL